MWSGLTPCCFDTADWLLSVNDLDIYIICSKLLIIWQWPRELKAILVMLDSAVPGLLSHVADLLYNDKI